MKKLPSSVERVIAVVVTYNPDVGDVAKLINALLPQVARAIVVDNASASGMAALMARWSGRNIELLQMTENVGIAAAQNAGIERAIALGADYILLSDQDSVPSSSMVSDLLATIVSARADSQALPVAAVGPAIVDSRTGQTSFFVTERSGIPRRWLPPVNGNKQLPAVIDAEFLIASGTLIPIDVVKRIGAMRSNYFIDHVDTEWSFRAKAAGYRLLGVPSATLKHRLGDEAKQIWFFGQRTVMYHAPLRDYYMFRNTLVMLRDTPMSWVWKAYFLWRLVQFAGYFLTFSGNRALRLKQMILGLLHGITGVSGRLDSKTNKCSALPTCKLDPGFHPRVAEK